MPDRNIRPGVARLFRLALGRERTAQRDIDEEIGFHIQQRTEQLIARGYDATSARLEAERRFGDVDAVRSRLRSGARRRNQRLAVRQQLADIVQDFHFALRSLRRAPGFLAVAITCLAIGIGGNAAIFSVIDAVLIRALPFREPSALVRIWSDGSVPPGIFDIVKRDSRSYSAIGGVEAGRRMSFRSGGGDAIRIIASQATDGFFDVLGERPLLGRTFRPGENDKSAPLVAVLSFHLWQSYFGADSSIIGKTVSIEGIPREVIGVMGPRFAFPSADVQVWTAARFVPGSSSYWWTTYLTLVARLKSGTTATQAQSEAAVVFAQARGAFPMRMSDDWGKDVNVVSLQESMVGGSREVMLLIFGAVALVLLIACVNVASLCIGRASQRSREMAVRTALGAGRARLVRLLLVESFIVSSIGAAAGMVLAFGGLRLLVNALPPGTPRVSEIGIDARVLAFTLSLLVISAMAFGLLPALRATSKSLMPAIRTDERSGPGQGSTRAGFTLAAAQLALAVMLVAGAGLLIKSFWQMRQVDLGFSTSQLYSTEVAIPSFANDTAMRTPVFYEQVLQQLRAAPGVQSAIAASALPFGDGTTGAAMEVEAHPTPAGGSPPFPSLAAVSDDYFSTMQIPIKEGRAITAEDRAGTARVAVVDEAAARALWPTETAIGQRIRYVWNKDWFTVVGVVGNVKRDSISSPNEPSMYVSMRQDFPRPLRVIVRSSLGAREVVSLVKKTVARLDATAAVGNASAIESLVLGSASRSRFAAILLTLFAAIALILGAVGVYGVLSTTVLRRTREIGVRMALGATSNQVLRMVLMQSAVIALSGVAVGVLGALWGARAMQGMLFGVAPTDVGVLAAVVVVLAAVTIMSALLPARRAARLDPLSAIRAE